MKMPGKDWISTRVLITVKTYPNPSWKFKETVCVAGITEGGQWIRIYPVKFRDLPFNKRFKKYDIVQMKVYKDVHDTRPESFRPDPDSFEIVDHLSYRNDWRDRKNWVLPSLSSSMCEIQRMQRENEKTLGVFKPLNINEFIIEEDNTEWPIRRLRVLQQLELFEKPKTMLEKIPYVFKYGYSCSDSACSGHVQTIYDWEVYALYRNLRDEFKGDTDQIKEGMIRKFLDEMCSPKRDTYLIVGNMHWRPSNFIVLGVFWPPKNTIVHSVHSGR